nr:MAG TPA: hypothetical protein [Caudoviricetes sp.]
MFIWLVFRKLITKGLEAVQRFHGSFSSVPDSSSPAGSVSLLHPSLKKRV